MSDQSVLTKVPNAAEIRAELEAMVVGDLLDPAGGESEELNSAPCQTSSSRQQTSPAAYGSSPTSAA